MTCDCSSTRLSPKALASILKDHFAISGRGVKWWKRHRSLRLSTCNIAKKKKTK